MQNKQLASPKHRLPDVVWLLRCSFWRVFVVCGAVFLPHVSCGAAFINEILFNPPGSDSPNEYIELRGTPNLVLPKGTWLVSIEGNAGNNPGTIGNVFDLSGRRLGGNGLLVLLQAASPYQPHTNCTVLQNSGPEPGWGNGADSSVGHKGRNRTTELNNASVTFFLLQSTNTPNPGDDIDANDDGTPDGPLFASWTILDSVGVLDEDGAGDFAYGAVNFRWVTAPGNGAGALGTIVPVAFTPRYVARSGNTTGSAANDWVAGDALGGAAPAWVLGSVSMTFPSVFAGAPLNHLGLPNFGAPAIDGVILHEASSLQALPEAGGVATCWLGLNTPPAGAVTIEANCAPGLEMSSNGGATFSSQLMLSFSNTTEQAFLVRSIEDNVLETSPHWRFITNRVVATADSARYPVISLIPDTAVGVLESRQAVLTEVKVNPPGTHDGPYEYIEVAGPPGTLMQHVWLIAVDGDSTGDPGRVSYALELSGIGFGSGGLLLIAATNSPYAPAAGTVVLRDPRLSSDEGALGNGSLSILLLSTLKPPKLGVDLDAGNDGVLEGLPADATLLDSVGWLNGDKGDRVYARAVLSLPTGAPDAAARFPGRNEPNDASAWFCGELAGQVPDALAFAPLLLSSNFPPGTVLTPGVLNNTAPVITGATAISGVIDDPANPPIDFVVSDAESPVGALLISADSSNPEVVPSTNLLLSATTSNAFRLALFPIGIGYSDIRLFASDGSMTGQVTVPYAASAPGRPATVWHIGASDGSTAIPLGPEYILLGDDENQTIRLYPRLHSDVPLREFDFSPFLGLPDLQSGLPREVDVEASTRAGQRIYWIGSHGHGAEGESRTNRTRIFATDITGNGAETTLTYAGRYDYLKWDLIEWDSHNLHGKGTNYYGLEASDAEGVPPKAPDGSGFAIEGMCMVPGSTNAAFIGFRAPIVPATNRTYALLVPILNLAQIVQSSSPPGSSLFGPPVELDLYGRGIRSIESGPQGFIIIGGPAAAGIGPYPQDFRLYTWSGDPRDHAVQHSAWLEGLNPEGIVELPTGTWTPGTLLELVSDNGAIVFYGDGIPAKRLPIQNFKKCRSDMVALGVGVKPAPLVTSFALQGAAVRIIWRALAGETYSVEACEDLEPRNWHEICRYTALGPYASVEATVSGSRMYYRVQIPNQ